jgi:FlaA1/EpsC-like NDP-sugar epimerase
MSQHDEIIQQMCALSPETHYEELLELTKALMKCQTFPGMEKARFLDVMQRGIPDFSGGYIPMSWRTVIVTGGTGCVGHAVLSRLIKDAPYTRYFSISRNPPRPERRVDKVNYLIGDIRDYPRMAQIITDLKPEMILHLAAQRDPGKAEREVSETINTNVFGSSVILRAAGEAEVGTVVLASTGKAVRFFTSDVYAATKKMVEYQAAAAAHKYPMKVATARFTHVVDNSLIRIFIEEWMLQGEAMKIHSPFVMLPIQSALECYHLLMMAGKHAEVGHPKTLAIRNLGWPPVTLLDMALDYLREFDPSGPRCPIYFTGYPPGYEAYAYPGTYDPLTAGEVSPLINCLEAGRTKPTEFLGDSLDEWEYTDGTTKCMDAALGSLNKDAAMGIPDLGPGLSDASEALLGHIFDQVDQKMLSRIHRFGEKHDPAVKDHAFIHAQLTALLEETADRKVS